MEGYEIRRYRAGDEAGILTSFNRVFREVCGEGYVDRNLEFWRWEFEDCPYGKRVTVGIAGDGTVAAHYGGVAYRMHTEFGDAMFIHIVDSFVVPEHRAGLKRPGLFVSTAYPWFDLCYEMGDAVMYGYPVKTAERVGSRYLDYSYLRTVDYLCRDAATGTVSLPEEVEVSRVDGMPSEVDELFDRFAIPHRCLTRRDRAFLDWRYLRIPGDDYQVFTARRDGALCGLMVLRPEHELVPDATTIADWVVPAEDEAVVDALLSIATSRARALGRNTVMAVFAPWSVEWAALAARGFSPVSSADYLERRLTYRIYHEEMTTEWLAEHWWYTLGDSDLV